MLSGVMFTFGFTSPAADFYFFFFCLASSPGCIFASSSETTFFFFYYLLLCKNVCRCYHEQKVRSGIIYVFVFFRLFFSRTNSRKTTASHARSWTLILTKTTLVCI